MKPAGERHCPSRAERRSTIPFDGRIFHTSGGSQLEKRKLTLQPLLFAISLASHIIDCFVNNLTCYLYLGYDTA